MEVWTLDQSPIVETFHQKYLGDITKIKNVWRVNFQGIVKVTSFQIIRFHRT